MSRAIVLTERGINVLAKPPGLRAAESLLLWSLIKRLPPAGDLQSLGQLADDLGLSRVTVTRSMRELIAAGLVQRTSHPGDIHLYKLNSACFHYL
jgi:DNA-binding MarR family transcriptional regulator